MLTQGIISQWPEGLEQLAGSMRREGYMRNQALPDAQNMQDDMSGYDSYLAFFSSMKKAFGVIVRVIDTTRIKQLGMVIVGVLFG